MAFKWHSLDRMISIRKTDEVRGQNSPVSVRDSPTPGRRIGTTKSARHSPLHLGIERHIDVRSFLGSAKSVLLQSRLYTPTSRPMISVCDSSQPLLLCNHLPV